MGQVINERLRKALQRLGLTEYEVRAYIALLEHGEATAGEISSSSMVPLSKVYETLSALEKKGWILVEKSRPARYRPQPPTVAVELAKSRIDNELDELSSLVTSELNPIYEKRADREKPDLWIIRGEENLWKSVREVVGRARRQLSIATPFIPKDLQNIMLPIISLMRERGGTVQILVGEDCDQHSIRRLAEICDVRVRELSFGGGVISDASEVVLILMGSDDKRPKLGIYSAHMGLTMLAQSYFDLLWATSTPLRAHQSS